MNLSFALRSTLIAVLSCSPVAGTSFGEDSPPRDEVPGFADAKPMIAGPKDDELRKLMIERRNTALETLTWLYGMERAGHGVDSDRLFLAAQRFADSSLALETTAAGQIRIRERLVDFARTVEKNALTRYEAGAGGKLDYLNARYLRIEAEIPLRRARCALAK